MPANTDLTARCKANLTFLKVGEVEWEVFVQFQCEITAHLKERNNNMQINSNFYTL